MMNERRARKESSYHGYYDAWFWHLHSDCNGRGWETLAIETAQADISAFGCRSVIPVRIDGRADGSSRLQLLNFYLHVDDEKAICTIKEGSTSVGRRGYTAMDDGLKCGQLGR